MSFMFELYYRPPEDKARERRAIEDVSTFGGRLTFREVENSVVLTFEFNARESAESAANLLRSRGEHIENIHDYG